MDPHNHKTIQAYTPLTRHDNYSIMIEVNPIRSDALNPFSNTWLTDGIPSFDERSLTFDQEDGPPGWFPNNGLHLRMDSDDKAFTID